MIRIVTDSNSQIPAELAARYDVAVVPIVVNVNGTEYREGVDLDADAFYAFWQQGEPEVSTSQPSPGDVLEVYRRVVVEGATSILSIHVGSAYSGTMNSARLAAAEVDAPVRLVDSTTMSFGVSGCVWEAAEALRRGADLEQAAAAAEALPPRMGSVTILQALEFTRAQGRLVEALPDTVDGIPVLVMAGDEARIAGEGRSVEDLSRLMVEEMTSGGVPIRVAVCIADASARPFYETMESMLAECPHVVDLVRYRVGPSVGSYTGPGAAGGFWYEV